MFLVIIIKMLVKSNLTFHNACKSKNTDLKKVLQFISPNKL